MNILPSLVHISKYVLCNRANDTFISSKIIKGCSHNVIYNNNLSHPFINLAECSIKFLIDLKISS